MLNRFACCCITIVLIFFRTSFVYAETALNDMRIVALSPHLTELTFLLGRGEQLVAVSDYSNYPEQANSLPIVASYQGADIAAILRLNATHILAWRGGNKNSDIQKLLTADIEVHQSSITDIDSLLSDIRALGKMLNAKQRANDVIEQIQIQRKQLQLHYQNRSQKVFYYLSDTPLMTLGNDPWLNSVLALCGLDNIFKDSISPYPQVNLAQVLRLQPEVIIAAGHQASVLSKNPWSQHEALLKAKFIWANPDKLHRFTPRAIDEIKTVCEQVYTNVSLSSKIQTRN